MKKHTNIIITAVASLLIVTLAGREFIKNHKKESNDKSSTNVSENTCEDILDTSIPDTSISDTCVADTNTPDTSTSEADILIRPMRIIKSNFIYPKFRMTFLKNAGQILQGRLHTPQRKSAIYTCTARRL